MPIGGDALRMVVVQPANQACLRGNIGQKQYWTKVQILQLQETFRTSVMFPDNVNPEILRLKVGIRSQGWNPLGRYPASQGSV